MIESTCLPIEVSRIEVKGFPSITVLGQLCNCSVQGRPVITADGMIHMNPQGRLYRAKLEASGDFRKMRSADSEITLFLEPEAVIVDIKIDGFIEVVYDEGENLSTITVTQSNNSLRFGKNVCSECPVK